MKLIHKFFLVALCFCAFTNKAMGQFSGGDGSESDPYIITTPEELAELATLVNEGNIDYNDKHYLLDNDIDLSGYQIGEGWIPIGRDEDDAFSSNSQPFKGVFDGNGNTIKNLFINNTTRDFIGLFGYIEGTVKNLGITDANITLSSDISYAGGIVGGNAGTVSNCYSTGSVSVFGSESSYAGGIVGGNIGTVSNCYSTGMVNASGFDDFCAGGIGGLNIGIVLNCYSTASVSASGDGEPYAGGVVGGNIGSVSNCYSTGLVSASGSEDSYAGGIVGASFGDVSNCVALNPNINCIGSYKYFGRVTGYKVEYGTCSNNIAFNDMLNPNGNTTWKNKGADQIDGEDINIKSIHADGTLGGRFTDENGWTTENGKLPGLFGNTVDMPEHLGGGAGISDISTTQTLKAHTQNGIVSVDGLIPNEPWFVFDLSGRIIYENIARNISQSVNLEIRSGVYIVKSGNEVVKLIAR